MVEEKKETEDVSKDLIKRMSTLRKVFGNNIIVSHLVTKNNIVLLRTELVKPEDLFAESDDDVVKQDDTSYFG